MSEDIHVVSDGDDWLVRRAGAQRASARTDTQQQAIDRALEIARNSGGAEVNIHGRNGQIRDKRTIGKRDPFPPPG